ncbi:MAG: hypothetical protein AB7U20_02720 [Planctomycetaceae bacterium]
MRHRPYQPGDAVVYRKTKHAPQPGPRARSIVPTPNGEDYVYLVDKFWIVAAVRNDGMLVLETRRGKQHVVNADDPNLKPAGFWTRYRYGGRFPTRHRQLRSQETSPSPSPSLSESRAG